ncbi:hypothetical protein DH2020_033118 [Rehmannia glutinosa]|uniref:OBG-type G domain-containing protein n=1 Tax=Rehmannia glutinosa TaxID=99300 RepID=A0ABR0VG57_REHGL
MPKSSKNTAFHVLNKAALLSRKDKHELESRHCRPPQRRQVHSLQRRCMSIFPFSECLKTECRDCCCSDPRLNVLSELSKSQRAVPASIEFVDIAGLVKGASQGEGLGNKFLSHIREVDSILQVVRCFEDNDIIHVNGKVDPKSDIDIINLELVFSDLDQEEAEKSALVKIEQALMDGKPARSVSLTDLEKDAVRHLCLLTMKPVIYVANVAESDLAEPGSNSHVKEVMNLASELQSGLITVSAQVEAELTELPPEERIEYLTSLGVNESGLGNLIRATYSLLGMRTYFTSGEKVAYDDFVAAGSFSAAREKGLEKKNTHTAHLKNDEKDQLYTGKMQNAVKAIGSDLILQQLEIKIHQIPPSLSRILGR